MTGEPRAKLQSNHHHQQKPSSSFFFFFYRSDALPVAQPINQHNHKLSSAWALWRQSTRHG